MENKGQARVSLFIGLEYTYFMQKAWIQSLTLYAQSLTTEPGVVQSTTR